MEVIWSLGLVVFLLLALNHMAGGRPSNVLRPVAGIANGIVSMGIRLCMSGIKAVAQIFGASLGSTIKLPPAGSKKTRDSGPTPPRWEE